MLEALDATISDSDNVRRFPAGGVFCQFAAGG